MSGKVPPNRTSSSRRLSAQSKLVGKKVLHPRIIHYKKQHILFGHPSLDPEAPALNPNRRGSGPTDPTGLPAGNKSPAILNPDYETALFQAGYERNTPGFV